MKIHKFDHSNRGGPTSISEIDEIASGYSHAARSIVPSKTVKNIRGKNSSVGKSMKISNKFSKEKERKIGTDMRIN